MEKTKGFITIATGKEEYYVLARNLLRSYRHFCKAPLPFAILADRRNEYTSEFDDVLIFEGGATNSYLDKLELGAYLPYDTTIFIDADCLAYGDLNKLFHYFEQADDFSCFGRVLALDDKSGWFEYDHLGELKDRVSYVVGLHGGIYYMRKTDVCRLVFETAKALTPDYPKFKFKGKFDTPGDEPLIALSMALNNCKPIPFKREAICCYWEYTNCMAIDISEGQAEVTSEPKCRTDLVHWGTRFTRGLLYQEQIELLDIVRNENQDRQAKIKHCKHKFMSLMMKEQVKVLLSRAKNKILRTIGIK